MKFAKILATVLAVCLLSCAFVACDTGSGNGTESATETATKFKASVTLVIKEGDKQVDKETLAFEGNDATLKSVIEFYCAIKGYASEGCFASTGLCRRSAIWKAAGPATTRARAVRQARSSPSRTLRSRTA